MPFFFALIILALPFSWLNTNTLLQSIDCTSQTIHSNEIFAAQDLDINLDGVTDQVVIYGDDTVYVLVALNRYQPDCKIEVVQEIISRALTTGRQNIEEVAIKLVELTRDKQPEIYVTFQESGGGGGPRDSFAVHAIYVLNNGQWNNAFLISQCLAFHSFEFREGQDKTKQDIYFDEDRHCEPPWSSSRTYNILRWDGTAFRSIDSGTIESRSTNPWWLNIACLSCFAIPLVGIFGFAMFLRKMQASRHET
jgi:hypothetical protein